jgi:hypothetical protein
MKITRTSWRIVLAIGLFIAVFQGVVSPAAGQTPSPPQVRDAAQAGLRTFLAGSPQALQGLGFGQQADIDQAILGDAFQVYTVSPERLLQVGDLPDLQHLAVPTPLWQFVVRGSGGAPRAMLTVGLVNGEWTAVALGAAGLAEQLVAVIGAWPPSAGYQHRLIRIYQAKADLVEVTRSGAMLGLVPCVSARMALNLSPSFDSRDLRPPTAAAAGLRPIVARALRAER